MNESVVIVAATSFEIAPMIQFLEKEGNRKSFSTYQYGGRDYSILITGVGPVLSAHGLAKFYNFQKPGLAIQAGIAGGSDHLIMGEIVQVVRERFGDIGVEESDGSFTDVFELELSDPNFHPFEGGWLNLPEDYFRLNDSVRKVSGITVSKVTGTPESASILSSKYGADIETMEGASFFYACLVDHVKFISIRSISNYIGLRDRTTWNIPLAIETLNQNLIELVQSV